MVQLLEVKIPYDPSVLLDGWLVVLVVGQLSVCVTFTISYNSEKLHFLAPIGALVYHRHLTSGL